MENFIVSARKYRPATFDDVVGQQALTNTLKRAIVSGKLASAYLFCGPRGVGKTTCARIFAKAINCLHPQADGEACNVCESCVSFNEQRSMNIQELNAAANNSVEDIRQIIDQVRIPPQLGRYKIIILDEVHMLSQSASNALLKTLEEPPSYVIFILATTEKQKILPTILSRCQIFDFNRMEIDGIVYQLKKVAASEGIVYEENALNIIAQKADGGMRDALSIFDQVNSYAGGNITYESVLKCLNVLDYDYYFKMTDLLLGHQVSQALLLFNEVVNAGFDGGIFMGGLAAHLRDVMVSRDAATTQLLDAAASVRGRYAEQAQRCSLKFLYRAIRMCDRCSNEYKSSYNKRLSVEITLIETAQLSDDDAAGPGPAKTLKPLFKETAPAKTPAPATPQPVVAAAPKPVEEKTPSVPPVVRRTPKINISAALQEPTPTYEAPTPVSEKQTPTSEKTAALGEDAFDEKALRQCWDQFAKELPSNESAVSGRMVQMDVELVGGTQVKAYVNNDMALDVMKPYASQIEQYLKEKLNNRNLRLSFKVRITEDQALRYNPQELFNKLTDENPGLAKLRDAMGLELN